MRKPRDPLRRLTAIFYRDEDGVEPVRQFIASLLATEQGVLDAQIDRLNDLDDATHICHFPLALRLMPKCANFGVISAVLITAFSTVDPSG